jgi:hypothetical protein
MTTTIDLSGPFFRADPARTFRQNVRVMMRAVAAEGESDVKAQMQAAGREGAAVRPYVRGRTSNLAGKPWAVSANVSVETSGLVKPAAVRIMAIAAGRHNARTKAGRYIGTTLGVEGNTHAFRKTKNRIARSRKVNEAELLKGLT